LLRALPDHIASVGNDNYGSYDAHRKGNTRPWSEEEQSVMRHFTIKWVAGRTEMHTHSQRQGWRYNTKRGITDKAGKKLDEPYPEDFFHSFRRNDRALTDGSKQILGRHHESYYSFLKEVAAEFDALPLDEQSLEVAGSLLEEKIAENSFSVTDDEGPEMNVKKRPLEEDSSDSDQEREGSGRVAKSGRYGGKPVFGDSDDDL